VELLDVLVVMTAFIMLKKWWLLVTRFIPSASHVKSAIAV
jgi:hypothetical protein